MTSQTECHCHKCKDKRLSELELEAISTAEQFQAMIEAQGFTMILCPTCGNKRCPHASNHNLKCSGSNEPGQPGSVY